MPGCPCCMRLSAREFLPANLTCHCLRPGPSGVITMCYRLWVAEALTRLVFIRPLQASAGSFATRQTACYPQPLATAIASCVQPFLSVLPDPVKLTDWRQLLPPAFLWPASGPRVEDGAGTSSSAFWGVPRETDFLRPLRSLWLKRLETPGLLPASCRAWSRLARICPFSGCPPPV